MTADPPADATTPYSPATRDPIPGSPVQNGPTRSGPAQNGAHPDYPIPDHPVAAAGTDPAGPGPHADAVRLLREWRPAHPAGEPTGQARWQNSTRHTYLAFLDARPDGCLRSCVPGHLTASAMVLDATGRHALLTLHPRVGEWLQLGGHCEPGDPTMAAAALREATEESGITGLTLYPWPVQLETHPITCSLGLPTRHLDVRFLAIAPPGRPPVRSAESDDLRWWPVDGLPPAADGGPSVIADLVAAALRAHRRHSTT